jgi:hypothetical protein
MHALLELATVLFFASHLLAVNLAMGGPLLCLWLQCRGVRHNEATARVLDRQLAAWSQIALGVGILLGGVLLALLWLLDSGPYLAAVRMVPRDRLIYALLELLFSFACMGWYSRLARRRLTTPGPSSTSRHMLTWVLAIATASNLMLHFPVLFAILAVISHRPELWDRSLDRTLYHALFFDPEVVSRVVHVWLAAIATASVAVMLLSERILKRSEPGDAQSAARRLIAAGARTALVASLLQLPVGLWLLFVLPQASAGPIWDGDLATLLLLGSAVLLAMLLLQQLAGVALGDFGSAQVRRCAATLGVVVLLMCGTVHRLQRLAGVAAAQAKAQPDIAGLGL